MFDVKLVHTNSMPWDWSWLLLPAVILLGAVYVQGWRCRQHEGQMETWMTAVPRKSLLSFSAGLILLGVALFSPLNHLAQEYFFLHALQQLLLIAWIPGLIMLANPLPLLFHGLPAAWRERLRRQQPRLRRRLQGWEWMLAPGSVYTLFIATYWFWYDPLVRTAALQSEALWLLEKITLLSAALLYWWHITEAWPRLHQPMPPLVRVLYTLVGAWPIKLIGIVLLFSGRHLVYPYSGVFQLSGLSIDAHGLGGMVVWVLGGIFYSITATLLMRRWLSQEEEKPALPVTAWANEQSMRAPGID